MHSNYRLTITLLLLTLFLGNHHANAIDIEDKVLSLQERLNHGLIQSIIKGDLDEIRYLIKEGADVNAKDNTGRISLYYAIEPRRYIRKIIDRRHVKVQGFYPERVFEIITTLIEAKVDVNTKYPLGKTPLHHASSLGDEGFLKTLIKAGANIHATDEEGNTPLHVARSNNVAQMLIHKGASIFTFNKKGLIPLETVKIPNAQSIFGCHIHLAHKEKSVVH